MILFIYLDRKCVDYKDSKCKFWSFVPKKQVCYLLSSCEKKDEVGVVSGEKGCEPKSESFTVHNSIDADLTECKATWEPSEVCPVQAVEKNGKIPKGGSAKVTYFDAPPSIECTKLTEVLCKWGNKECKSEAFVVPVPSTLFVKTKGTDDCEITTNPKIFP